ncbi:MAG: hypothetical protein A2428_15755 [Bdellovibrionales bacterium RIFOXYC1_FULL_54_43]|nr:MAG: hypothetical protein A2428_15755 [Bdellovibrionales bacterium RIFOXYC1_FULL_54_43]OFZ78550.1 MAG: hypothetical protein A2603_01835 [Bdellovibrionales bacterium RIFOXYD1_FULL_55_31]
MDDSRDLILDELAFSEFPKTHEMLRAGLSEGTAPGIVAGYWDFRQKNRIRALGLGVRRVGGAPIDVETFFDLSSVTKVFATATLAAVLVDRGWISWDTPLRSILPEYPHSGIELRHLLSHTAGLPAWEPFWEKLRSRFTPRELYRVSIRERQSAMRELVFSVPPGASPGERAVYSDLSFLLLGFALEQVTGMPLDQAVRKFVWDPMGVRDAFYRRVNRRAESAVLEQVAATENCPWRGAIQGQVHDDNCWAMGGYGGHAGAFAKIRDLLQFARSLMTGFLSSETRRAAWSRVSSPAGCLRTLGWDTPGAVETSARGLSDRSVGHLGFTGTSLWIDPERGLAIALLTNRVHPTRENIKIRAFRPRFHEVLVQEILALK